MSSIVDCVSSTGKQDTSACLAEVKGDKFSGVVLVDLVRIDVKFLFRLSLMMAIC